MTLVLAVPLAVAIASTLAGRAVAGDGGRRRLALAAWAAWVGVVAIAMLAWGRGDGVSGADFLLGTVIAVFAYGVVTPAAFYALGRRVPSLPVLVTGLVLALVPLYVGWVLGGLLVGDLTQCGPDAYECPV